MTHEMCPMDGAEVEVAVEVEIAEEFELRRITEISADDMRSEIFGD